jgi:hypothetical protein
MEEFHTDNPVVVLILTFGNQGGLLCKDDNVSKPVEIQSKAFTVFINEEAIEPEFIPLFAALLQTTHMREGKDGNPKPILPSEEEIPERLKKIFRLGNSLMSNFVRLAKEKGIGFDRKPKHNMTRHEKK